MRNLLEKSPNYEYGTTVSGSKEKGDIHGNN